MTSGRPTARPRSEGGFTVVELALVLAILGLLAALGGTRYLDHLERTRRTQMKVDLKNIDTQAKGYEASAGAPPPSLAAIGAGGKTDVWGRPYVYLRVQDARTGELRMDRFLVPINSDFDLYSEGRDGASRAPLSDPVSRDDLIRANDGSYYGLAESY